jgi:Tfp pilus assembly protein PilO
MSKRWVTYGVAFGLALIWTGFFTAYYLQQTAKISTNLAELQQEKKLINQSYHEAESRVHQVSANPHIVSGAMDTSALYSVITNIAYDCRTQIAYFSLAKEQAKKKALSDKPFEIRLRGNYNQAMDFMHALRQVQGINLVKIVLDARNADNTSTQSLEIFVLFEYPLSNGVKQ